MTRRACGTVLATLLALGLAGCGGALEGRDVPNQTQGVQDVLEQQMQEDDGKTDETSQTSSTTGATVAPTYEDAQVDLNLTAMTSDMVYATVNDMMVNPSNYTGKVVRIQGPYYHTYYEETATDYFYVIVEDATACCSQGIEFVWGDGSHAYPDDYPSDGARATVTGAFETYREEGGTYAHLVNADMVIDA